jgi:molybdopterin molybdotransferase
MNVVASTKYDRAARAEDGTMSLDAATARAIELANPVAGVERVTLYNATGRALAGELHAEIAVPPFSNSAMDGYAVRSAELADTGPRQLVVAGRIAAGGFHGGQSAGRLEAVRIFTGAPIPAGFDAVVIQEHCEPGGDKIIVSKVVPPGQNVRRAGEDVQIGVQIAAAGDCLTPRLLALLASQGLPEVDVKRKVRIGLISTGSELRDPGAPLGSGQIYNVNRVMLRSMLSEFPWAEVVDFGVVADCSAALVEMFAEAQAACDVLVTTGGVSVGDEDHVVASFGRLGGVVDVLKVAMRPGKPVKIGTMGAMLFAGLPGNPNAALATFRYIALPAIRAVAGFASVLPHWSAAVAGFAYEKRPGRTEFVPVRTAKVDDLGRPVLELLGRGSSSGLRAMAKANGLAMLQSETTSICLGAPVLYDPF